MATEPSRPIDAALRGAMPVSAESKRRVRLADGQRKGFETAWNEYFDCYATTTYLESPPIRLEDIAYHLYLKKNINPTNPRWELPSFRQLKKILGLSQDKLQGIEARLVEAGLLLKESGKGKGTKGENVANDYLLYEPLEIADFLVAVEAGRLPGTLNEKGRRKLAELRERLGMEVVSRETGVVSSTTIAHKQEAANGPTHDSRLTTAGTPTAVPAVGTGGVPASGARVVPLFGTGAAPEGRTTVGPISGTQNRRSRTDRSQQTKQQQAALLRPDAAGIMPNAAGSETQPVVVVAGEDDVLVRRGITAGIADRLRETVPAEVIARQVEIFDFLRAAAPDDPKLTPGRLRRQIEQDWAAPAGFVPAAERAAREAAAARQAEERRAALEREGATATDAGRARQALLEALGLAGADQATWARIAQATPPLPPPFRDALFHAPGGDEAAAVIFADAAALARATGPAHAAARARVAARVADLCGRPGAPVHYLLAADLLRMLGGE